eukprot:TRINITY_DN35621_c0_g1_i1.p2 TRINITY_DN35621_c0_g1~~TRINITY_DN35621_c0_g1_i1.p2  ORF type:complete len:106 (+),score=28.82 TRINITY_DN35621_c0_g1_i1:105-422(+)
MVSTYILGSFFFFNDTATTEIYTLHIVGSVRCVQETGIDWLLGARETYKNYSLRNHHQLKMLNKSDKNLIDNISENRSQKLKQRDQSLDLKPKQSDALLHQKLND